MLTFFTDIDVGGDVNVIDVDGLYVASACGGGVFRGAFCGFLTFIAIAAMYQS